MHFYLQLQQYGRIRDDDSHPFQHRFVQIDLAFKQTINMSLLRKLTNVYLLSVSLPPNA